MQKYKGLRQNFDGHISEVGYCMIFGFGFSMFVYGNLHQIVDRGFQLLCISKRVWKMDFVIGLPRTLVDDNVSLL